MSGLRKNVESGRTVHGTDDEYWKGLEQALKAGAAANFGGETPVDSISDPMARTTGTHHGNMSLLKKLLIFGGSGVAAVALLGSAGIGYREATDIDPIPGTMLSAGGDGSLVTTQAHPSTGIHALLGAGVGGVLHLLGAGHDALPDTLAYAPGTTPADGNLSYLVQDGNVCATVDLLKGDGTIGLPRALEACVLDAASSHGLVDSAVVELLIPDPHAAEEYIKSEYIAAVPGHTLEGDGQTIEQSWEQLFADPAACGLLDNNITAAARYFEGIDTAQNAALAPISYQPDHHPRIEFSDQGGSGSGLGLTCG